MNFLSVGNQGFPTGHLPSGMNFLFWLFFVGLLIACAQDVKRREVDNWLNLFLLMSGSVYLIFSAKNLEQIFLVFAFILFFFVLSNLLYYCRFFAGGDAKLLFAMTPFFVATTFNLTLWNIVFFIFVLFLAGSIYGLAYTAILGIVHFKKMKKEIIRESKRLKLKYNLLLALVLAIGGFTNSLFLKKNLLTNLSASEGKNLLRKTVCFPLAVNTMVRFLFIIALTI